MSLAEETSNRNQTDFLRPKHRLRTTPDSPKDSLKKGTEEKVSFTKIQDNVTKKMSVAINGVKLWNTLSTGNDQA